MIATAGVACLLVAAGPSLAPGEGPTTDPVSCAAVACSGLTERLLLSSYRWDLGGGHLAVSQGGRLLNDDVVAGGLAGQLSAAPAAAELAARAHGELLWGKILGYGGAAAVLGGAVLVSTGAAQPTNSGAQVGLSTSGALTVLLGVAAVATGAILGHAGLAHVLEAVNAFNLELVARPSPP